MKLRVKPADRVNDRIAMAREYLSIVGWARGTHGVPGAPCDLRGALSHCEPRDGFEVVAARMLASRGFDEAWNDLICANQFEARQALDQRFDNEDFEHVYGKNWYSMVGIMRLLAMASADSLDYLAESIGPADEPAILSLMDRVGPNPAFDDVLMVGFDGAVRPVNRAHHLLYQALVANALSFPDIDDDVAIILLPVAEKLGL